MVPVCILFFAALQAQNTSVIFVPPAQYNLSSYKTIEQSYKPPQGFSRVWVAAGSFAAYLRALPLVKDSINVLDFKNRVFKKSTDSSLAAVVPVNISGKRLWQCMDILIRFHVDYLQKNPKTAISYPLPDGTPFSWQEWQQGMRPIFKGLSFSKVHKSNTDSSLKNFTRYLNTIFEYSGTQSFWHHYPDIHLKDIHPGDFIVKKGRNGHAVLIVDIAENSKGQKIALIGQGDTPACQFYLLKQKDGNTWFTIDTKSDYPLLPIKKKMFWAGLRRFPE